MEFKKKILTNGLAIIGEVNTSAKSAAVGFFVKTGSRDESKGINKYQYPSVIFPTFRHERTPMQKYKPLFRVYKIAKARKLDNVLVLIANAPRSPYSFTNNSPF